MMPPRYAPMAHPQAKMAIREEAAKSEKPMSCSHIVKNTMAFQGVEPTIPCSQQNVVIRSFFQAARRCGVICAASFLLKWKS